MHLRKLKIQFQFSSNHLQNSWKLILKSNFAGRFFFPELGQKIEHHILQSRFPEILLNHVQSRFKSFLILKR